MMGVAGAEVILAARSLDKINDPAARIRADGGASRVECGAVQCKLMANA